MDTSANIPRLIACNHATPTGSKGYVCRVDTGMGGERVNILQRGQGGRYIQKWYATKTLCNFRVVAVPDSLLGDERVLTNSIADLGEMVGMLGRWVEKAGE